jgi:sarcosine oxidase subunit gamma
MSAERRSLVARKLVGAPAAGRDAGVVLADRTLYPRAGFKGRGALAWLKAAGVELEATPNRSFRQPGSELAAVLAMTEALILSPGGDAALVERLEGACPPEGIDGCYPVPRRDSHFWFRLEGADCPSMFAKLCGVDLRAGAFPDGAIAQTSLARMSAIVIRDGEAFHLLGDSASAEYFWDCLVDAMAEFSEAVGG